MSAERVRNKYRQQGALAERQRILDAVEDYERERASRAIIPATFSGDPFPPSMLTERMKAIISKVPLPSN